MRSNFLTLLPEALNEASRQQFRACILDIHPFIPNWRNHPNDWRALGIEDAVNILKTKRELDDYARLHIDQNSIVLFLNLPDRGIRHIWRALAARGAKVGVITVGPLPVFSGRASSSIANVLELLKRFALSVKRMIKPVPDFWIMSGTACRDIYRNFFSSVRDTCWISAHSIDYENTLKFPAGDGDASPSDAPIVFLDQGWFSKPPPYAIPNNSYPPASYSSYRESIHSFLVELEDILKRPVVISLHPKASRSRSEELYAGHELSTSSSAELVSKSSLVVGNSSTSIQYAVIYGKPVLLYTSNELQESIMHPTMLGLKKALGAPVVNIDKLSDMPDLTKQLGVDTERYRQYLERYVRMPSAADAGMWEIVFRGFREQLLSGG